MWDITKIVLRRNFATLHPYTGNEERTQNDHLSSYLKKLEKKWEWNKPKVNRRKELTRKKRLKLLKSGMKEGTSLLRKSNSYWILL